MDARALYRLTSPTAWAEPPSRYSFSSLKKMGQCLRQWQLARSTYGDLTSYPERPNEAAEIGSIVHEILSRLFHATALAGYPPLGSPSFRSAVDGVDILGVAREQLDAFAKRVTANPRAQGSRPRATPRDIYNKVAAAFRGEYATVVAHELAPIPAPAVDEMKGADRSGTPEQRRALLDRVGVLSEEHVEHPTLPLHGFIDLLVRRDGGTTVLDFKTGASRPEYRDQVLVYALMWWRSTGDLPSRAELRYGARVESWLVTEGELARLEQEVKGKIARASSGLDARPAAANVGAHCAGCSVRQLCGDYWQGMASVSGLQRAGERVDIELVIASDGTRTGFVGHDREAREITVVFEEGLGALHGPFSAGRRLRVLGAARDTDEGTLRLAPGTEVFHVG
jgi:hypothetical protein